MFQIERMRLFEDWRVELHELEYQEVGQDRGKAGIELAPSGV